MLFLALAATFLLPKAAFVKVTPPGFEAAKEPQIAIDRDHSTYVAYGMGDSIYVSKSTDGGKAYEPPVKVAEAGKLSLGRRRGPRIAVHGGTVTVTATYGSAGKGADGDLVCFRSTDAGRTWSGGIRVNDVANSAREGLHAMAMADDGTLAATWLDLRSKGTQLYLSTSKDGGAHWSKNRLIYKSPTGTICECCHPSLAFDHKGRLYVMFRNCLNDTRDMFLTSTADLGNTFSEAEKLGAGTWQINACPMDGGCLAVGKDNKPQQIWRREKTLFWSAGKGNEDEFVKGNQPWLAAGTGGDYLVWTSGSALLCMEPNKRIIVLSESATNGVVSTSSDGKVAVAAWAEQGIQAALIKGDL